ncbi:hypothetical protein BDW59DRAFT_154851 [Aspergillus cavernicola]|uniref:ABM domain-containing protein n=1 Tax=Aspergillus cavernicola TaxID=176166 RepID=A0ABR4HDV5_9EURO
MSTNSSTPGISLQVSVFIAEENVPKFFEAFLPVYEKVIAEPECTFFEIYQNPQNPGELSWVENWSASMEWLIGVQVKKSYYEEYLKVTTPMFIKEREIKILNRLGVPYAMVKTENGGVQV